MRAKDIQPFHFREELSHQQVADYFNSEYPISLKHNQELVERVYQRYPLIDKSEVGVIVKAVFSSFRDLLILGKILNFNGILVGAKLFFFQHRRAGRILPSLKVRLSTPPQLRNYGK